MPKIITASIGPTEHMAIKPKLFSPTFFPPRVAAIPTPRAIINGTVMGPVVTPPESKARARKFPFPFMIKSADSANRII